MFGLPPSLTYIFLGNFAFAIGMGLHSFLMPSLILSLGATPVIMGTLFSLLNLFSTLILIPGGLLADRFDRRKLILISWAMCIPAPIGFALARHWTGVILPYLLFYGSMFANSAFSAYVAASCDQRQLGRMYSLVFAGFPLGAVIAPTVGGWLAARYGLTTVFIASSISWMASTAFMSRIAPQKPVTHSDGHMTLRSMVTGIKPAVIRTCIGFAGLFAVLAVTMNFVTPYLQNVVGLPLTRIGIFSSIGALGGALLTPVWGRLGDRLGFGRAAALGMAVFAAGILLFSSSRWLPIIAVSFLLRSVGDGVRTLMGAQIARVSSPGELGRHYAIYNILTGAGGTVGPYLGGWLYAAWPALPFTVTAGLALLTAVLALGGLRRGRGPAQTSTT